MRGLSQQVFFFKENVFFLLGFFPGKGGPPFPKFSVIYTSSWPPALCNQLLFSDSGGMHSRLILLFSDSGGMHSRPYHNCC